MFRSGHRAVVDFSPAAIERGIVGQRFLLRSNARISKDVYSRLSPEISAIAFPAHTRDVTSEASGLALRHARKRGPGRMSLPSSPRRAPLVPPTSSSTTPPPSASVVALTFYWLFASATSALGRRDELEETRAPLLGRPNGGRGRVGRGARCAPPCRGARHDSGPPHQSGGTRAPPELHHGGSGGEEEAKVKPNLRLLLLLFLRGR